MNVLTFFLAVSFLDLSYHKKLWLQTNAMKILYGRFYYNNGKKRFLCISFDYIYIIIENTIRHNPPIDEKNTDTKFSLNS